MFFQGLLLRSIVKVTSCKDFYNDFYSAASGKTYSILLRRDDVKIILKLEEHETAEFVGMAQLLGQSPEKFATDAVLEYMQTLNDNPDRFTSARRQAKRMESD